MTEKFPLSMLSGGVSQLQTHFISTELNKTV